MKLILKSILVMAFLAYAQTTLAGSMKCKGKIFQDDTLQPLLIHTVRENCGPPYAQEVGMDIYKMPNGKKKSVRYNGQRHVQSITDVK